MSSLAATEFTPQDHPSSPHSVYRGTRSRQPVIIPDTSTTCAITVRSSLSEDCVGAKTDILPTKPKSSTHVVTYDIQSALGVRDALSAAPAT